MPQLNTTKKAIERRSGSHIMNAAMPAFKAREEFSRAPMQEARLS
jgi:hypothetical protein